MTDKEILFTYRLNQAEETLSDAKKMLEENISPRFYNKQSILFYVLCGFISFLKN